MSSGSDGPVLDECSEVVVRDDGQVWPVALDAEEHLVAQLGEVDRLDRDADPELLFELGTELGEDRDPSVVVHPEREVLRRLRRRLLPRRWRRP